MLYGWIVSNCIFLVCIFYIKTLERETGSLVTYFKLVYALYSNNSILFTKSVDIKSILYNTILLCCQCLFIFINESYFVQLNFLQSKCAPKYNLHLIYAFPFLPSNILFTWLL